MVQKCSCWGKLQGVPSPKDMPRACADAFWDLYRGKLLLIICLGGEMLMRHIDRQSQTRCCGHDWFRNGDERRDKGEHFNCHPLTLLTLKHQRSPPASPPVLHHKCPPATAANSIPVFGLFIQILNGCVSRLECKQLSGELISQVQTQLRSLCRSYSVFTPRVRFFWSEPRGGEWYIVAF